MKTPLTLEELKANADAAAEALAAAEYKAAHPVLPLAEAQANLAAAESNLASVEGSFWEFEHARVDLNGARNYALTAPDALKAAAEAEIPKAEQRYATAKAAFEASGVTAADMDAAAQAVLDAREMVAKAEAGNTE